MPLCLGLRCLGAWGFDASVPRLELRCLGAWGSNRPNDTDVRAKALFITTSVCDKPDCYTYTFIHNNKYKYWFGLVTNNNSTPCIIIDEALSITPNGVARQQVWLKECLACCCALCVCEMSQASKAASAPAVVAELQAGRTRAPRAGVTDFNDPALYKYFACFVPDPSLRFAMRAELERRKMQIKPQPGAKRAVRLETLEVLPEGFVLQWRREANTRAGYAWWKRVADGIRSFDANSAYYVVGAAEWPPAQQGGASGAEQVPAPAEASLAPVRLPKRRLRKKAPAVASQPVASQPEPVPLPDSVSPRETVWPRFKVRRLLGALVGERGVGGRPEDYPLGDVLGAGSYGIVYKSSLGGVSLAVKVVQKDKRVDALLEASLAQEVAGHPNLVDLKDAVMSPSGASMLVYLHAGRNLEAIAKGGGGARTPAPRCMLDCMTGLSYLHSLSLYHADIKPANILIQEEAGAFVGARIADLGGLVEVCPGNVRLERPLTTFNFRSPEILAGQQDASGASWLRADVWALGITLAHMVGFSPTYGHTKTQPLRRVLNDLFHGRLASIPRQIPECVHDTLGAAGVDFLDSLLAWSVEARPDSKACLGHAFLQGSAMRGHGFASLPPSFPGAKGRHEWTLIQGTMSPEVLRWVQDDVVQQLDSWFESTLPEARSFAPMPKWRLTGKTVETPASDSLNGLPLRSWLPAPRLLAWLRAFKEANAPALARMQARALAATGPLAEEDRAGNAEHFLDSPLPSWFLSAGELHIFQNAAGGVEPRHSDGGASVLHMGVTLYGRRELTFFAPKPGDEGGLAPESEVKFSFVPGSVYLGTVTGAPHQVSHLSPRASCEERVGYSVTCMIRTTLFPKFRSRVMNTTPSPPEFFQALAQSFTQSLQTQEWVLPSLDQCLAALGSDA